MTTAPRNPNFFVDACDEPDVNLLAKPIEDEIAAFDEWFMAPLSSGGGGNSALVPGEKALLRTYLIARLSGRFSPRTPS